MSSTHDHPRWAPGTMLPEHVPPARWDVVEIDETSYVQYRQFDPGDPGVWTLVVGTDVVAAAHSIQSTDRDGALAWGIAHLATLGSGHRANCDPTCTATHHGGPVVPPAADPRPWCGAPRALGGQQPCPIKQACPAGSCRLAGGEA